MPKQHVHGFLAFFKFSEAQAHEMVIGGPLALERTERLIRQSIAMAPYSQNRYSRNGSSVSNDRVKQSQETFPIKEPEAKSKPKTKSKSKHSLTNYMMKSAAMLARNKRRKNKDDAGATDSSDVSRDSSLDRRRENWMENGYSNYMCVPSEYSKQAAYRREESQSEDTRGCSKCTCSCAPISDTNTQFARLGRHLSERGSLEDKYDSTNRVPTLASHTIPRTVPKVSRRELQDVQMLQARRQGPPPQRNYHQDAADQVHKQMMEASDGFFSAGYATEAKAEMAVEDLTSCAVEVARSSSLRRQQKGKRRPNGNGNIVMV